MLAVKHDISYEILPSPINLELIIIKIISSSPIIYCVVYIPLKSSAADEYLHELYEFLITLKSISDSLVLLGDLILMTSTGSHCMVIHQSLLSFVKLYLTLMFVSWLVSPLISMETFLIWC